MLTHLGRLPRVLFGIVLVGSLALLGCGGRGGGEVSTADGCAEAMAARAEALASVDTSTKLAIEKNSARAGQLQGIAQQAGAELAAAVDLGPCEDDTEATGMVVDLADIRARYVVVLERTQAQLDQTAAQPVRGTGGGTKGGGTKGGTKGD